MEKLIITAAITGAEVTKEQCPAVPYTVEEMVREAKNAYLAGASIIHIHVRKDDGTPTQSKERFEEVIRAIKAECPEPILQVSTGGAAWMTDEERIQPIYMDPTPEMATLDCGTCNFGDDIFVNKISTITRFADEMRRIGIKPELEVFDRGMVATAVKLMEKGHINSPAHFDFVLGVEGAMPATVRDLQLMVDSIPSGCTWTVAGIGRYQLQMAPVAIVMGGHVRVGLEDNIYYAKGRLARSNAELVDRVVRLANELQREVAAPDEARRILGIK
ncbi:MAG: 3-keto-5-aminohexanoate cleavage protein [Thermoanaerobacteraceae bacterium]|nr:3-keto-5-aminohexanoate cleavage protein [Thermoanaerobacteraceae bacterium]